MAIPLPLPSCGRATPRWSADGQSVLVPKSIAGRALVLVRYDPALSADIEPVYNLDAARIDDNRIVLAHDLGPQRNAQIFDYYAKAQPDRSVYLFDRLSLKVTPLGNVAELAHRERPQQ